MKKVLLLTIIIISIATTLNAQISKGSVLLGRNLNFNSSKKNIQTTRVNKKVQDLLPQLDWLLKQTPY